MKLNNEMLHEKMQENLCTPASLFSGCRRIGTVLLIILLLPFYMGQAQAAQPGIDDFVDFINEKITDIQTEIRKGPGTDFTLIEQNMDLVIRNLELNWHTLSITIVMERETHPSYVPKPLMPIPAELTDDYFKKELDRLQGLSHDLREKIDKLKIQRGIKQFATLINILFAAYQTASTATDLLNPNLIDLYNLPSKVDELKKIADQINTSANSLQSAKEALKKAMEARHQVILLSSAVRATYDSLVTKEITRTRLKQLRDLAADHIASADAILVSTPPPPENNFDATPFITEISRLTSRLQNGTIRWPAAAQLRDVIHERAGSAYDESDRDNEDTAEWSRFIAAYTALQDLFAARDTHVAALTDIGNEWKNLVADLLTEYQAISAGTDATALADCSARHTVDPGLVVGYDGFTQEWWQHDSNTHLALKRSDMPVRQGERTLDLNTGTWLDFVAAYPDRVKAQLIDPYSQAADTMMASMDAATERNQHVLKARPSKAYQMPLLTRDALDTMRRNLRLIQGALVDFETDFQAMVTQMQGLESRFQGIEQKALAYQSYIAANAIYLNEGDFISGISTAYVSADHNADLSIFETGYLTGTLKREIDSLPVFQDLVGDTVNDVWEQASALERWLDDLFRFNEAISGQGHLAERMAPYMTGVYTGYGSPGYLYDSLAILDNTLYRIMRYEVEGNQYDSYGTDKESLKTHVKNIAAMSPSMLADFASLTEAVREWTSRMAYIDFYLQSNRPYKTDAKTRGRYPFWAVAPPPPGWPVFSENRAAVNLLNAVHWPNHGFGGSSERYGFMTPDDIRAGIPAVRSYVAGITAPAEKKPYAIVRIDPETPRLTEGAISFNPFQVWVMDENGDPAAGIRIRMTRGGMSGTNSGTPGDQYTVTDAGGLGEFYLGPYALAGNRVEVIDVPGGKGKIEVAIEVVPHTQYAAYDGEGGMSSVTTPMQPPPVELPDTDTLFPPVPAPVDQGREWDVLAQEAFTIPEGAVRIDEFLSFKGRLTALATREWLTAGTTQNRQNLLWTSRNGEDWVRGDPPPWSGRKDYKAVVHEDRLFIAGGIAGFSAAAGGTGEARLSDIWYTDDGIEWVQAAPSVQCLAAQDQFRLISDGESLWMIGYETGNGMFKNPLWSSPDGITWTSESETSPWPARAPESAGITFHDGAIWLAGGLNPSPLPDGTDRDFADVWVLDVTAQNPEWSLVTNTPAWSQRAYAQLFSHRGILWLWGGSQRTADNQNAGLPLQVWISSNGSYWSEPGFTPADPAYARASDILSDSDDLYAIYSNSYLFQKFSLWRSPGATDMETTPGKQQWFPVQPRPATFSAGANHAAAIAPDHSLWTWGGNNYGQLGNGNKSWNPTAFPQRIGAERGWKMVRAGENFTLAIASDNRLWSWGRNNYGQLGTGSTEEQLLPVQVGQDTDWAEISAGNTHALARKTDGSLWAWGRNNQGQIGDGTSIDRYAPVRIGDDNDWTLVSAGDEHSLALKADGSVWGWGRTQARGFIHDTGNMPGQGRSGTYLDTGASYDDWQYFREGVIALSAGGDNGMALRKSGTIHPWTPDTWKNRDPFDTRKAWVAAAAGQDHFLALASDNSLWGWGKNDSGILGTGAPPETAATVRIDAGNDWIAIQTGGSGSMPFAIAQKQDGSLWAWGNGSNGQLGNGMTSSSGVPRPVLPFHKYQEDSDEDWLPDTWEMEYFSTLDRDGIGDFDGDRVSDFLEYYFHMRPDLPDTDGDGILDDWELIMALDPSFDDSNLLSADVDRTTLDRVVLPARTVGLENMRINNMAASDGYVYLMGARETGNGDMEPRLMVISLKADQLGDIVADQAIEEAGYQLRISGTRLYTHLGSRLGLFDISDPANPVPLPGLSFGDSYIQGFDVAGDLLYATIDDPVTWESTFQVWNIAIPETPVKMGECVDCGDGHIFSIDPDRVVVTGGGNQLVTVNVADPENPVSSGIFDTFEHPCGDLAWPPVVMTDGPRNLIYAPVKSYQGFETSDLAHLKILDISNPADITYPPRTEDRFRLDGWIDSLVPLADRYVGMLLYDNDTYSPLIQVIDGDQAPEIHTTARLSQFRGNPGYIAADGNWFMIASQDTFGYLLEIIPLERLTGSPPDLPKSMITLDRQRAAPGEPVFFNGSRSFHRAGNRSLIRAEWDFDYNGTTFIVDAQGFEVFWQFPVFGTYTVALRTVSVNTDGHEVTDTFGLTHTNRTTVTLLENRPVARFTLWPLAPRPSEPVIFDANASEHALPGRRIVKYEWDFSYNGQTFDPQSSQARTVHTFPGFGDYVVALRVTDDAVPAVTAMETMEIQVSPGLSGPVAVLPDVLLVSENETLVLDGNASFDRDFAFGAAIQTWEWDLTGNFVYNDRQGEIITLSWPEILALGWPFPTDLDTGLPVIPVGLKVTSNSGVSATAATRLIIAPAGDLTARITADSGTIQTGVPMGFSASESSHSDPGKTIQTYEWDFDYDGLSFDVDAQGMTVSHSFARLGSHTVALRIADDGDPAQLAMAILAIDAGGNQPPSAHSGGPYTTALNGTVTLDASGSSDPDEHSGDRIVHYAWDLDGDGFFNDAAGIAPTLSADYLAVIGLAGPAHPDTGEPSNRIHLRVTDSFGASDTAASDITFFQDEPMALFTMTPDPAVAGTEITFDASSSMHGHPDRQIILYEWDFDYDQSLFKPNAQGNVVTHTFTADQPGETIVALRVTDDASPAGQHLYTRTVLSPDNGFLPMVRTLLASVTASSSAVVHGSLLFDGGSAILDRGVVFSKDPDFLSETSVPAAADSTAANGFSASLTGLDPETTYFVKAWAENGFGRGYGRIISFITLKKSDDPITDLIMDNGDPGTLADGDWLPSGLQPSTGTNSLYTKDLGASYTYEQALTGCYKVSMWWPQHSSRHTEIPVQIYDGDQLVTEVTINQQMNGGQWNLLLAHEFTTSAKVIIWSVSDTYATVADAVRFEAYDCTQEPVVTDLTVDNAGPGTSSTGLWLTSGLQPSTGPDSEYSKEIGASYTYAAFLNGSYLVSLWWTAHPTRFDAVPVEIYDGNQLLHTEVVNQQTGGGQWNSLGVHVFTGTARVVIHSESDTASTSADAVRFDLDMP
jgi:alpha-tubulin suppressor-like RCC1 family protein